MSPEQSEHALSLRAMSEAGHARAGRREASPRLGIRGPAGLTLCNAHPHVTARRAVATVAETPR